MPAVGLLSAILKRWFRGQKWLFKTDIREAAESLPLIALVLRNKTFISTMWWEFPYTGNHPTCDVISSPPTVFEGS